MSNRSPSIVDPSRLARVATLSSGAHKPPNGHFEACAMEAVAYIAGEPWSDHPECACPVIAVFMRSWNDALSDDERTAILLPFVPRLVGTRGDAVLEARRATMAASWYVRAFTPAWLRLAGLNAEADVLAGLPEITSFEKTPGIRPALEAAQKALSAAESAARSAALSAARSAARSTLDATRRDLQKSAIALLDRMIAAGSKEAA